LDRAERHVDEEEHQAQHEDVRDHLVDEEVVARAQDLAADAGHAEYLGGDDEHPAASEPGADPGRDPRHRRREDDRSDHVEVAAHAERPAHVE